jgi:PPM family protein phosphatase
MTRTVVNWGVATSQGLVRENNEDALFAQFPVFVVADGMGGQAGGEIASGIASEEFRTLASRGVLTIADVDRAIAQANETVRKTAGTSAGLANMGTTLVGLALVEDHEESRWLAFNVGDSRLYRLFGGAFTRLTTDHSEVQALVDEGTISEDAARSHPNRNIITRAIGIDASVEPDFWLLPPVPGERFLVCSDGLTNEVPDGAIAAIMAEEADPGTAATRLVERAVAAGGHDNISTIVVDVLRSVDDDLDDTARMMTSTVARPSAGDSAAPAGDDEDLLLDVPGVPVEHPADEEGVPVELIEDVPLGGTRANGASAAAGSDEGTATGA